MNPLETIIVLQKHTCSGATWPLYRHLDVIVCLCLAEKKKKSKKRAEFDVDALMAEATGDSAAVVEPPSTLAPTG